MEIKTILVPTDFSESSQQAVEMASLIARSQQAMLVLVHVLDLPVTYSESPLVFTFAAEEVAAAERDLAETAPSDPAIVCERKILKGETATSILLAVDEVHADLIVVGTHGRTGALHILLGSVAEKRWIVSSADSNANSLNTVSLTVASCSPAAFASAKTVSTIGVRSPVKRCSISISRCRKRCKLRLVMAKYFLLGGCRR